jgi:hypothetical protein
VLTGGATFPPNTSFPWIGTGRLQLFASWFCSLQQYHSTGVSPLLKSAAIFNQLWLFALLLSSVVCSNNILQLFALSVCVVCSNSILELFASAVCSYQCILFSSSFGSLQLPSYYIVSFYSLQWPTYCYSRFLLTAVFCSCYSFLMLAAANSL